MVEMRDVNQMFDVIF